MASEQEELLKALKEIVDSLKSVSQYSKDLSSAVAAANRPMQQMSDLAKAMNASMSEMAKTTLATSDAMGGMVTDVADVLNKVQEVGKAESESVTKVNEANAAFLAQKKITEELRAAYLAVEVEQASFWTKETKQGKERNEKLEEAANWWEKIKKSQTDSARLDGGASSGSVSRANTAALGLTGASNTSGAISQIASSMSTLMPTAGGIGGLIGMMMYGKMKEAEFNALGQVAAQQFDQVGGYSDAFAGRLVGLSRKLSVAGMAAKEDIARVSGAMVEMGLTAKDAQTKIEGFTSAAGNDFMALTLSMDKAFEMAAGTAAKFGGTLVRDFNMSTKEAATNLQLMAQAARESGANVSTFMMQTMEASSALRLLNANQSAVFTMQAGVSNQYQKGGMNQQNAGAYAAKGVGELTGAIGGQMQEGVRAVIAQKMYGGDALDALYKLQSPVARKGFGTGAGKDELDTGGFIREMGNIMKEAGVQDQGPGAQYKFAESVFGVGTAGADAFMKAIEEQRDTGKVSAETQKEISKGLTREADKMSVITRIAEAIKDAVAQTMVGLLGMIVNGLKMLYNVGMYTHNALVSALTVGGDAEADYRAGQYMKNIESAAGASSKNSDMVGKALDQAAAAGGKAFEVSGLKGGWSIDESPYLKKLAADAAAKEKAAAASRAVLQTQVEKELSEDKEYQELQRSIKRSRSEQILNGSRFQIDISRVGTDGGRKNQSGTSKKGRK